MVRLELVTLKPKEAKQHHLRMLRKKLHLPLVRLSKRLLNRLRMKRLKKSANARKQKMLRLIDYPLLSKLLIESPS